MPVVARTLGNGSIGVVLASGDDRGFAYSIGYVFGVLLAIGVPVALIVRAVTRRSGRTAAAYRSRSVPPGSGQEPAPDAVWDGARWLRWDGARWLAWDGTGWRYWDGSRWIGPPVAPPPSGDPLAPPLPPPN